MYSRSVQRVLVAEDEIVIALELGDIVRECGYDCAGPVRTTADAINLVETQTLDAAILDMRLAGGSADAVCRSLAARHIPFAFASALCDQEFGEWRDRPRISKPFSSGEVQDLLSLVLSRSSRAVGNDSGAFGRLP